MKLAFSIFGCEVWAFHFDPDEDGECVDVSEEPPFGFAPPEMLE